jgi:hypothetical protein
VMAVLERANVNCGWVGRVGGAKVDNRPFIGRSMAG